MKDYVVLFSEEDTLFRLMETALNRSLSPMAERALHYFFGEDISKPLNYLMNLSESIGLPSTIRGIVCVEEDRLEELLRDADFLIVERTPVTRAMIEKVRGRLKLIQKFGQDYKNIDIVSAKEMGIPVANLLRISTISVAEHVILLILALARGLVKAHKAALARREAKDSSRSEGPPRTLFNWGRVPKIEVISGKTLGLLGLGENGLEVAKRAYALGMKIIYHQRNRLPEGIESKVMATYVPTLIELMERSDFVTVHIPYSPSTEKIINYEVLSHMKPDSFFINSSRGGLVDEMALYRVLSERRIRGAALDVYRWEPIPEDCPLLGLDNVVWSTHNAGGSPEFMLEESKEVLKNIARILRGERPEGLVMEN